MANEYSRGGSAPPLPSRERRSTIKALSALSLPPSIHALTGPARARTTVLYGLLPGNGREEMGS